MQLTTFDKLVGEMNTVAEVLIGEDLHQRPSHPTGHLQTVGASTNRSFGRLLNAKTCRISDP